MERKVSQWIPLLLVFVLSGSAHAGLYERISADDWGFWPREKEEPAEVKPDMASEPSDQATPVSSEEPLPEAATNQTPSDSWVKPQEEAGLPSFLLTKDRKAKYVDERFDPILLLRNSFVYTFIDNKKLNPGRRSHRCKYQGGGQKPVGTSARLRAGERGIRGQGTFQLLRIVLHHKIRFGPSRERRQPLLGLPQGCLRRLEPVHLRGTCAWARMKIPFSQANMTSTEDSNTVYSPVLNVLIPKRQLGASLEVSDPWKAARLRGGIYNSVASATQQLKDTDELLYSFRVDYSIGNTLKAIHERHNVSGISTFYQAVKRFDVNMAYNYADVERYYDTGGEHRWFGFDGKLVLYIFTISGEYVVKDWKTDPKATQDGSVEAMRGTGFHADFVADVWPEIISVFFRYEGMDGDDDFKNGSNKDFPTEELIKQKKTWMTLGMNFHVAEIVRMDFNYIMRKEEEGFDVKNDVLLGMIQLAL